MPVKKVFRLNSARLIGGELPLLGLTPGSRNVSFNQMDYSKIITIEAGKRSGKPCIRGMRITVSDILSYLASGMTEEEIVKDFPELTREDIKASLAFAADREGHLMAVHA